MDQYTDNNNQNNEEQQSYSYTWQNPSPYTSENYTGYNGTPKPKKQRKKLSSIQIALIALGSVAICLFVAVCVLITALTAVTSSPSIEDDEQVVSQNNNEKKEESTDKNVQQNLPQLQTQAPTTDALTIPQIYQKVKDSVVGIIVTVNSNGQFSQGSGTGIILSEDGYISTNAHVVSGATTIKVVLTDETEYTAELIGADDKTDLAVLKIEKTGLTPAEFGDSESLVVGETVVAIGNPYGLELAGTVTSGIVSALNRELVIESTYMTLIQTDASINPGNSGGPLVNSYGQVIGITSSKIVTSGYEGIGFAIPISGATDIIGELIQYGYIKNRPLIGIYGSNLDETYAKIYSIPMGVYVEYVDPESDANAKGLKKGDIITAVDGVEIKSMAELDAQKNKHQPGESITLKVYRNTKYFDITIKLSESTGNE